MASIWPDAFLRVDQAGDEFRLLLHPAEERGAARVLPGEAEEVEARHIAHSTAMTDARPSGSNTGRSIQELSGRNRSPR